MSLRNPNTIQEFIFRESLTWLDLTLPIVELPDEFWTIPGASGDWSLKDVWAHIADWMKETRRVMPMLIAGKKVSAKIQAFNKEHYAKNRNLKLAVARRRLVRERRLIMALIKRLPEEKLFGNRHVYAWASYATYNHYAEHIPNVVRFARSMQRRKRHASKK
jgi:hypothetical protein